MKKFKHNATGTTISSDTFYSLSSYERAQYNEIESEKDSSDDFLLSALVGSTTNSAVLGSLLGGSLIEGVVGDMFD